MQRQGWLPLHLPFSTSQAKNWIIRQKFLVLRLAAQKSADYKGATTAHAPFVYRLGRQIFIL